LNLPSFDYINGTLLAKSQNAQEKLDGHLTDAPARYDSSTRWLGITTQEQPTSASSSVHYTAEKHAHSGTSKSSVPLAEVLNDVEDCDVPNGSLHHILQESNARKRRRVEATERLQLPKPQPLAKKTPKRARIPPLLPGLYEPPPDAGIIPSITTENFTKDITANDPISTWSQDLVPTEATQPVGLDREARNPDPAPKEPKQSRHRRRWTDEETAQVLQGVALYGIGSWKKILSHPEYTFNNRTYVDLKDR